MPAGRPSKFKTEFIEQAKKLCALAATDLEIADFFEVNVATLYRWKNENKEFCESLKIAKAAADSRVERSLFARANGYEHDEVDIRVVDHSIVQTKIRKFYPPDTVAAIFWLKNRKPEQWRDRQEITGANGEALMRPAQHMTTVELREAIAKLKNG